MRCSNGNELGLFSFYCQAVNLAEKEIVNALRSKGAHLNSEKFIQITPKSNTCSFIRLIQIEFSRSILDLGLRRQRKKDDIPS